MPLDSETTAQVKGVLFFRRRQYRIVTCATAIVMCFVLLLTSPHSCTNMSLSLHRRLHHITLIIAMVTCCVVAHCLLHPIPITRFRLSGTQPLEDLSAAVKLPINKKVSGQPNPWKRSCEGTYRDGNWVHAQSTY